MNVVHVNSMVNHYSCRLINLEEIIMAYTLKIGQFSSRNLGERCASSLL